MFVTPAPDNTAKLSAVPRGTAVAGRLGAAGRADQESDSQRRDCRHAGGRPGSGAAIIRTRGNDAGRHGRLLQSPTHIECRKLFVRGKSGTYASRPGAQYWFSLLATYRKFAALKNEATITVRDPLLVPGRKLRRTNAFVNPHHS
jgi:hypothetical protein